jgi:hypothetical protein
MALIVTGTAMLTRITMMAAATISSIKVNPAARLGLSPFCRVCTVNRIYYLLRFMLY